MFSFTADELITGIVIIDIKTAEIVYQSRAGPVTDGFRKIVIDRK